MDHSPLAKLPTELRQSIYQLTLISVEPIRLTLSQRSRRKFVLHQETKALHPAALLQTCTEIRSESHEIFYSYNTFQFETESPDDQVARFLMTVPEETRTLLRNITVLYTPMFRHRNRGVEERQQRSILRSMIRLRKIASHFAKCKLQYKVEMEYLNSALETQGLPDLTCDLKDLDDPWAVQEDALDRQCRLWSMKGPHAHIIVQPCLRGLYIFRAWRRTLLAQEAAG